MSDSSGIEWTDATWNPVAGCTPVSPGCLNCYAAVMANRLEGMERARRPRNGTQDGRRAKPGEKYVGLTVLRNGRQCFNGNVRTLPEALTKPLHWKKPRRIFVNSMSDLFHEKVPFEFIDKVFAVMALCPQHTFQVLTKRPERMAEYLACGGARRNIPVYDAAAELLKLDGEPQWERMPGIMARSRSGGAEWWPLRNVWLGTSVENQATADERIPHLLKSPAAVRFLSCEPLLEEVDIFAPIRRLKDMDAEPVLTGDTRYLHWVIVGGESGPKSRACDVAWIHSIVKQCKAAGVPCFVKQLGSLPGWTNPTGEDVRRWGDCTVMPFKNGVRFILRDRKGGDPAEWTEDLRVREMPEERHRGIKASRYQGGRR